MNDNQHVELREVSDRNLTNFGTTSEECSNKPKNVLLSREASDRINFLGNARLHS
jgi:hypothetical protein